MKYSYAPIAAAMIIMFAVVIWMTQPTVTAGADVTLPPGNSMVEPPDIQVPMVSSKKPFIEDDAEIAFHIWTVAVDRWPTLKRCHLERKRAVRNYVYGPITAHWTVTTGGKTDDISFSGPNANDRDLVACLTGVMERWHFYKLPTRRHVEWNINWDLNGRAG